MKKEGTTHNAYRSKQHTAGAHNLHTKRPVLRSKGDYYLHAQLFTQYP